MYEWEYDGEDITTDFSLVEFARNLAVEELRLDPDTLWVLDQFQQMGGPGIASLDHLSKCIISVFASEADPTAGTSLYKDTRRGAWLAGRFVLKAVAFMHLRDDLEEAIYFFGEFDKQMRTGSKESVHKLGREAVEYLDTIEVDRRVLGVKEKRKAEN